MLSKRLINSNDAAAGGACTTNNNDYPTTNVAYYKMSTAADEKDTYNGTPSNVNFNVQGKFGNAAEFNGSSSYINTTYTIPAISTYSLSLWFKTSITGIRQYLFADFNSSANTSSPRLTLAIAANNNFQFYLGNGSINWTDSSSASALSYLDDNWHNLVLVINGTSVKLYADGNTTPIADLTSTVSAGTAGTSPVSIGRIGDYSGLYFNGKIDQVRIFSSALSAAQVSSLYNEVYCVPTIVPTSYFNSVLYTGSGGSQNIDTVGFQPDFTWIKQRNDTNPHSIFDSVRGAGKLLSSQNTSAQSGNAGDLLGSFRPLGFQVNRTYLSSNFDNTNLSGADYVAWSWKAGGAAVSNTDGSITTQVSANVDAGFSIISASFPQSGYTNTFGHSLNSTPELIIYKPTSITLDWFIFSNYGGSLLGTNNVLRFTTAQAASDSLFVITNETFKVAATTPAHDFIAYAFHSVDGYSKIGSYVGNGSATGPIVVTGFRPAFVMIKCSSSTESGGASWLIYDNKRSTTNPRDKRLYAEAGYQEAQNSLYDLDFSSNGFQPLNGASNYGYNTSGNTYIFMAFAEEVASTVTRNAINPFGDSSEVALYKFEDDATDAEGNYDATSSPNVTYASGYIDKAAVFNGTNAIVALPSSSSISQINNFSLSFWVKPNGFVSFGTVVKFYSNYRNYVDIRLNGVLGFNTTGTQLNTPNNSITDGVWQHVALTKSSTAGTAIYINGTSVATNSSDTGNATIFSGYINYLGGWDGASYGFPGSIDQFRIFNRALDSGEAYALYNE
jgi:hypothetical protein